MSNGLNESPKFIQALGQIVLEALGESSDLHNPDLHNVAASRAQRAGTQSLVAAD